MDKIWAPWRMDYIRGIGKKKEGRCVFCAKPAEEDDAGNLILRRAEHCYVILNAYPYNNGHLMVIPYRHVGCTTDLREAELNEMMAVLQQSMGALKKAVNAEGFNWGCNNGSAGGAGIAEHLHIHIVPRWNGDTNYMPVIAETKVLSECLDETYKHLKPYF